MIKTILVATSGTDSDVATLTAALSVARGFAAHLDALHVRLDAVATAAAMAVDTGAGVLTAGLVDRLEHDASEREARARDIFARFCAGANLAAASVPTAAAAAPSAESPSAEFHVEIGDEARWITAYGTAADLIVARRGGGEDVPTQSTLEAALFDTGRPILIPAAAAMPESFKRIAIAWKPTPQAARAVALALPFLMRAEQVLVVSVEEDAESHDTDHLVRNLGWHGFAVTAARVPPGHSGAAASLLAAVSGRADLLVMGGYGHSRLREWVFGGFTQHVLADAPLPVLIAH
ncbi:MAG: universal stress protein [Thiohalocapsa sp.]